MRKTIIYGIFIILALTIILIRLGIQEKQNKGYIQKQKQILVGTYVFSHECNNKLLSNEYKTCSLKIKTDGTFQFNRDFGFIYDNVGTWMPRDKSLYSWNKFIFKKKSNKMPLENITMDVGGMYLENDSLLQLNSITSKLGFKDAVDCFYMRKIPFNYSKSTNLNYK